jgi:SsrA-binding protein
MAKPKPAPTRSTPPKGGKAKPSKDGKVDSKGDGILLIATNRRAFHDYHVIEQFEAGMVLVGTEVKSLRNGHCQLLAAYAKVDPNEDTIWLLSMQIPEYKAAGPLFQHPPQRQRKLLLHRKEVEAIRTALNEKGTTLIPLKVYFKGGRAKVMIGVCRGKRDYDKRETLKKREDQRRIDRTARR